MQEQQSNNQVPWAVSKSINVEQTIRSLIAMAERNCLAAFNCDAVANCDECPFYNSDVEFSCYEAYPADYWRAMLKDYISKQPLHKLISRKEFFALVDARDYVPEPLHSALYRICEKYESEK